MPATRQLSNIAVWQPAFSSDNTMVVGYNGYWYNNPMPTLPRETSGEYKSIWDYGIPTGGEKVQQPGPLAPEQLDLWQDGRFPGVYTGPLAASRSRLPDMFLKDYGSMAYAAVFDEQDNLYIGDLNRGRVLIYKRPLLGPATCSVDFADVPPASSFEPYVECLVCRGILSGYNSAERCAEAGRPCFRPGDSITRGQMAKIVSNAAGFTEHHVEVTFSDVPTNHPFYIYIERLASRHIVSGYGTPGNCPTGLPCFLPGATVSRGQMAKFVSSAARLADVIPPSRQTFADVPRTDTFWLYIERLASRNVVGGYACGQSAPPDSTCGIPTETCDASNRPYYRPCSLVTRGQAAKFVSLAFFPACEVP